MGGRRTDSLRVDFDRQIKLEFHGSTVADKPAKSSFGMKNWPTATPTCPNKESANSSA